MSEGGTYNRGQAERRDDFIGQALFGILSNPNCNDRDLDFNVQMAIAYAEKTLELAGPLPAKVRLETLIHDLGLRQPGG